jgi:hypothetical protein
MNAVEELMDVQIRPLRYATEIARNIKPGNLDPVLLAALVQAMAINYAPAMKA